MGDATNATIDEAIRAAIDAALDPARVRELVEQRIADAMADWVRRAMSGWADGSPSVLMRQKVEELLCPAIERLHLDDARVDLMLSKMLEETVVAERRAMLGKYAELAKPEPRNSLDFIRASELLSRYEQWCAGAYDCSGREVEFDSDGPSYGMVECRVDLEVTCGLNEWSDYQDATLTLCTLNTDEEDEREYGKELRLWRRKDGDGRWHVQTRFLDALSLCEMDEMDVYLARIALLHCDVEWDYTSTWHDGEFEPEAQPECEWS